MRSGAQRAAGRVLSIRRYLARVGGDRVRRGPLGCRGCRGKHEKPGREPPLFVAIAPKVDMAKTRPSVQKRRKEAAMLEKRQAKAARKAKRDADKANKVEVEDGVDPDLVGIVAGPQPVIEDDFY